MHGACASYRLSVKSGPLLVQIKETLVQLITGADLLHTETKMLGVCLLYTSEALKSVSSR